LNKDEIKFLREKDYKFIKELGRGGSGETILIQDEIIDKEFACKKLKPQGHDKKEELYKRFLNEIKILHNANHKNIVRIFNYYLYPEHKTGYVLMEYINGKSIDVYINENPNKIDDIFKQVISAFLELEKLKVLHRDIRPMNIMVSEGEIIKVIDFGFGKGQIYTKEENSVHLNWPYELPDEIDSGIYDFQTEIYFIGKLFEKIIKENRISKFSYKKILERMIIKMQSSRIESFFAIEREIINSTKNLIHFTDEEKSSYQKFANNMSEIISKIYSYSPYIDDLDKIEKGLENLYHCNMLEEFVQNSDKIISIFIEGNFKFWKNEQMPTIVFENFLNLYKHSDKGKRKVILNNIWSRLDSIDREKESPNLEELPF
jgi:eukaryotic-like serine/threonine-protein kinase